MALALGRTLAEIDTMSAWEFNEWQLYDRLFPFGDERDDWRMGTITAATLNPHRGKGKPPFAAKDFVLKPPQTQKQKEAGLKSALKKASKKPSRRSD